jgi:hypothetical protein
MRSSIAVSENRWGTSVNPVNRAIRADEEQAVVGRATQPVAITPLSNATFSSRVNGRSASPVCAHASTVCWPNSHRLSPSATKVEKLVRLALGRGEVEGVDRPPVQRS